MLKQENLVFLKALSTIKASPALFQELRKVRLKEKGSRCGKGLFLPKQAWEHGTSSSGSSMETAIRHPAPGPLSGVGSTLFPATAAGSHQEGSASMSTRNPGPDEVRATYAAVVYDSPSSIQTSGKLKPNAKESAASDPAASPEADTRSMSLCDMPWPLRGMHAGATIPNP
jgi:hypothetical protein